LPSTPKTSFTFQRKRGPAVNVIIAVAVVSAVAFVVLLVLVAIGSHLEDHRASIRKQPPGRFLGAVRHLTGLHVRNPGSTHGAEEPANENKEVPA